MNFKSHKIGKFKIFFTNKEALNNLYQEAFINNEYFFSTKNKTPFIIDCGSYIGTSILYFKSIYPNSEILGFEPNPETYKILKTNIKLNKLKDVTVINAALSNKTGYGYLRSGPIDKPWWHMDDTLIANFWGKNKNKIKVETVRLSSYINRPVDLLKLDIEGSETIVMDELRAKLNLVNQIVMEFHISLKKTAENDLEKTKEILNNYHFDTEIVHKNNNLGKGYDLLLIHAKKNLTFRCKRFILGFLNSR